MRRKKRPDINKSCTIHQKQIAHILGSIFWIRPTLQHVANHKSGNAESNQAHGLRTSYNRHKNLKSLQRTMLIIPFIFYPSANDAAPELHQYRSLFLLPTFQLWQTTNHRTLNWNSLTGHEHATTNTIRWKAAINEAARGVLPSIPHNTKTVD